MFIFNKTTSSKYNNQDQLCIRHTRIDDMKVKIAVAGCCHGEIHRLYDAIRKENEESQIPVDLLICCGDFQSIRSKEDLESLACPKVYRRMGDFVEYYNERLEPPVLTVFVGGNHEASNVLWELHYGGWVAKNIFYLGRAGVINLVKDYRYVLRIAGLSGIYKSHDYNKGYFEIPPFNASTMRSVYHVRKFDVEQLACLEEPVDIMVTHDWPTNAVKFGDWKKLIRRKPHFEADIHNDALGNPSSNKLIDKIRPRYWFAAHLHTRYESTIPSVDVTLPTVEHETKFLALDKALPRRQFIEFLEIDLLEKSSRLETNLLKKFPWSESQNVKQSEVNGAEGFQENNHKSNNELAEFEAKKKSSEWTLCSDPEWMAIVLENHTAAPFGELVYNSNISIRAPTAETCSLLWTRLTLNKAKAALTPNLWLEWIKNSKTLKQQREFFCSMIGINENNFFLDSAKNSAKGIPVTSISSFSAKRSRVEVESDSLFTEHQMCQEEQANTGAAHRTDHAEEIDIDYAL